MGEFTATSQVAREPQNKELTLNVNQQRLGHTNQWVHRPVEPKNKHWEPGLTRALRQLRSDTRTANIYGPRQGHRHYGLNTGARCVGENLVLSTDAEKPLLGSTRSIRRINRIDLISSDPLTLVPGAACLFLQLSVK